MLRNYINRTRANVLRRHSIVGLLTLLVISVGCSKGDRPPLGKVTGHIKLDGKPTEGLGVIFSQPGYRSSSGFTNKKGKYELKYLKDAMGAVVGDHHVRIDLIPSEGRRTQILIPERYNRQSELIATVKKGTNAINFDLSSE